MALLIAEGEDELENRNLRSLDCSSLEASHVSHRAIWTLNSFRSSELRFRSSVPPISCHPKMMILDSVVELPTTPEAHNIKATSAKLSDCRIQVRQLGTLCKRTCRWLLRSELIVKAAFS